MEMAHMQWRQAAAEDEPLLLRLFAENKTAEFASLGLSGEQLEPLLLMQYRARQYSYAMSFPAAVDTILMLDGEPVGRHLVERQSDCYRGIDLAVLASHRNLGIGTAALRQIQQAAALEGIPFRLRVLRTNPALHLYERLGFLRDGGDPLSFEMEWQPPSLRQASPKPVERVLLADGLSIDRQIILSKTFDFLGQIGIPVTCAPTPSQLSIPGIQLRNGGLQVDLEALLYPGDLLYMAGLLAVMLPGERQIEFPAASSTAEKMAAMAWSYAAILHIGLPPEVVFHGNGYRGQAQMLLRGYQCGQGAGVPLLQWMGMTPSGQPPSFPRMSCWLRETAPPGQPDESTSMVMAQ
jgi:GNAT superfamily N-acetyltransferase